jgi:FMN-dependent oxidoreductase (nitrilotriacetate monooxygenase family)
MKKRIILNAFDMTCVSHQSAGTWRHPSSQAWNYNDLDYWTNMAKELERGHFDCLFIADVVGVYDVYRGSAEMALKDAAQVPVNDPFGAISAMAAVTTNVCFGITAAVTFEQPYILARRLSTLDHLTKGRIAWNVVSSYLNSAALNIGMDRQMAHDERYDMADEYMDVVYKLWEGSWEDSAVRRDKKAGIFTDATKVHPIRHDGKYFKVPGFHLCEPSPQRTPVIFQAGASGRGRQFASRHAEGMFILTTSIGQACEVTKDIRDQAEKQGRARDSIKIFTLLTVITGDSDEAAERKYQEYLSYSSSEGMLALYGGWTGIDFAQYDPEEPLQALDNDSLRTTLESLLSGDHGRTWTVRDVIKDRSIGGLGPVLVGGPRRLQPRLRRNTWDGDGFHRLHRSGIAETRARADVLCAGHFPPEIDWHGRWQGRVNPSCGGFPRLI